MTTSPATPANSQSPAGAQVFRARALAREQSPEDEVHAPPAARTRATAPLWIVAAAAVGAGLFWIHRFFALLGG